MKQFQIKISKIQMHYPWQWSKLPLIENSSTFGRVSSKPLTFPDQYKMLWIWVWEFSKISGFSSSAETLQTATSCIVSRPSTLSCNWSYLELSLCLELSSLKIFSTSIYLSIYLTQPRFLPPYSFLFTHVLPCLFIHPFQRCNESRKRAILRLPT